jgi:sugar transferase (PEP-CTERM/EpsH1 system associated)
VRVLFLTHRLPYAPNRGDRVRAYHLLRHLRGIADVDLISLVHDADEAAHVGTMSSLASSVRPVRVTRVRNVARTLVALRGRTPVTHTLHDGSDLIAAVDAAVAAHPPSVVLAYCSGMARLAFQPSLSTVPFVLDMVDVDSRKWASLAATADPLRSWVYAREARCLAAFERVAARRAFVTLVVTESERQALVAIAGDARIEVVPNGVDTASLRPLGAPVDSQTIVFCGVMDYPPNEEGALWLANEVWPRVRAERPDARLKLVGTRPTRAVRGLASDDRGISVTGHVDDVRPHLWGAAASAAPLLTARGVQNKVLEAVAAGLPVVATPVVMEGVPSEIHAACVTAGDPTAFAAALVQMLNQTASARRTMAERADLTKLSWSDRLQPVGRLLDEAVRSPGLPGRPA